MNPSGISTIESPHPFADTVARIVSALQSHNVKIFATIDQQAEARAVGLDLAPLTLILFGNPKAGTPLMVANPESGLDLPLKALVWADATNRTFISINTVEYIITRHQLPDSLTANLAPAGALITKALR